MKHKNGTKKGSEIMNTHTHLVLIPEVLEEDGVTSGGEINFSTLQGWINYGVYHLFNYPIQL